MILSICSDPKILEIMRIVNLVINVIRIAVPIILIFVLMIKLMGAITKSDDDGLQKVMKTAPKNIIAAALIFLVPMIVRIVVHITAPDSEYEKCITVTSVSEINASYEKRMEELVSKAEETLNINDYNAAYNYLKYIKDEDKRQGYEERLEKVKEKINNSSDDKPDNPCSNGDCEMYPVASPLEDGKIVFDRDTETLKVKIQQRSTRVQTTSGSSSKNYYLTYIWVEDPYAQSSKAQSSNYPSKLQATKSMLQDEVSRESLQNKLVIATNASAYYNSSYSDCIRSWNRENQKQGKVVCGDGVASCFCYPARTSDASYSEQYTNTQVGNLVITKGKVIRNWPSSSAIDKTQKLDLYGIDPKGNFKVFIDVNAGNDETRKAKYQEIIDSGIKDTITWYVPIILDNKTVGWKNNKSTANITAFCQINRNNFVIFSARSAVNKHVVTDDFETLHCQNGVNFDGGGSVELLYKDRNGEVVRIFESSYDDRENAEIFYFTEK